MRIKRTLRLKNAEVWKLDFPFICYLIILDLRRPTVPEDYPYLPPEDVDGRENIIKVFTVSEMELENIKIDEVLELVEDIINNVDQGFCDWNMSKETMKVCNKEDIGMTLDDILNKYVGFKNVRKDNWKYLSQD